MSTAFPNEPAGSTTRLNHPWDNTTGLLDVYSSTVIVSDGTAPLSPSNVARHRLEAFAPTGGGEVHCALDATYRTMFVGMWWKINAGFQGRIVTDKMFFMRGPGSNGVFVLNGGPTKGGSFYVMFNHNSALDNSHAMPGDLGQTGVPNVGSANITAGTWFKIEAFIQSSTTTTSRDGIVRWWINGTLAGNYTNINYGPAGLNTWVWSQTWDGSGDMGTTNTVIWDHYIDQLYISTGGTGSGSGGGGGTAITLQNLTPSSASLAPGNTQDFLVALSSAVTTNTSITLSSSSTATATVPSSVTVPAGQSSATFTATAVAAGTSTITATLSGVSRTSSVTVTASGGGGTNPSSSTYQYTTQFSSTQGANGWSYRDTAGDLLTYNSGTGLWSGSELYLNIWNSGCHPGTTRGAVLRWTATEAGSARITGDVRDYDTTSGDGVIFTIVYNSSTLYTKDLSGADAGTYSYDVTQTMAAGEYIDFIVNPRLNNSYDSTQLLPTITYTTTGSGSGGTGAPTISSFTPTHGNIASSVTIVGTNFNTTASNNTVTFNGAQGFVSSASATQLVVVVPPTATTGAIAVTTSNGTATGTTFTVDDPITPVTPPASNFGGSAMLLLVLP